MDFLGAEIVVSNGYRPETLSFTNANSVINFMARFRGIQNHYQPTWKTVIEEEKNTVANKKQIQYNTIKINIEAGDQAVDMFERKIAFKYEASSDKPVDVIVSALLDFLKSNEFEMP